MIEKQVNAAIDVETDGEMSKPGHAIYVNDCIDGFAPRPRADLGHHRQECAALPEYHAKHLRSVHHAGPISPSDPICGAGPIRYVGQEVAGVFMPSPAVTIIGFNEFHSTEVGYKRAHIDAIAGNTRCS